MAISLHLNIRKQDPDRKPAVDLRADRLGRWVEKLPKLNYQETAAALGQVLEDINFTVLGSGQRFEALEILVPEVESLTEALCKQCGHSTYPMPAGKREVYLKAQQLLAECCAGYKAVVVDLVRAEAVVDASHTRMRDAMVRATEYLGQRLVLAYLVYEDPPAGVWGELHRLYHFAEQKGVEGLRVEHIADQSVRDLYLRAVLMAMANPYHLMQGEALEVYRYLRKWALAASIQLPDEEAQDAVRVEQGGQFYVDLAGEHPPAYHFAEDAPLSASARVVQLQEMVKIVAESVKKLMLNKHLDMAARMRRDLFRRLRNAWGCRSQRQAPRIPQQCTAVVAAGMSACHHFLSGEREFVPEQGEVELHGDHFQKKEALSLVPLGDEQWKEDETLEKLERGVLKPRAYGFDVEDKEADVWKKAHTVQLASKTGLEMSVEQRTLQSLVRLECRDESEGGLGLDYAGGGGIQLRVGELVALRDEMPDSVVSWRICVVRWLFCGHGDGRVHLGLSNIADQAQAAAVRGLQGMGEGSHYLRALLVPCDGQQSIIVPAGRFDTGSHLLLYAEDQLQVCELQRLQQTNKTFSQFLVDIRAPTSAQQELIVSSLYEVLT